MQQVGAEKKESWCVGFSFASEADAKNAYCKARDVMLGKGWGLGLEHHHLPPKEEGYGAVDLVVFYSDNTPSDSIQAMLELTCYPEGERVPLEPAVVKAMGEEYTRANLQPGESKEEFELL